MEFEIRTAEQMRRLPEGQGLEKPCLNRASKKLNILLVVAEVFQQEITVAPVLLHLYPKL